MERPVREGFARKLYISGFIEICKGVRLTSGRMIYNIFTFLSQVPLLRILLKPIAPNRKPWATFEYPSEGRPYPEPESILRLG